MSELQFDCVCNVSEVLVGLALVGAACKVPDTLIRLLLLSSRRVGGGELWNINLSFPHSPATQHTPLHWTSCTLCTQPTSPGVAAVRPGPVPGGREPSWLQTWRGVPLTNVIKHRTTWQGRGPWQRRPDPSPGWRSCSLSWWDRGTGRGWAAPTTRPTSSPRQGGNIFFLAVGGKII